MPEAVDLGLLLTMAPRDAIDLLRDKGYQISWNWWDVWQREHARAFTVAKVWKLDALANIKESIEQALEQGMSTAAASELVRDRLVSGGFPDVAGRLPSWRIDNILRTNFQSSQQAARWQQGFENRDARPFVQYLAIRDENTRPSHRAMHGRVFPIDDPIWLYWWPPNGFRCRCRTRFLTAAQVEARGLEVEHSQGKTIDTIATIGGNQQVAVKGYVSSDAGILSPDPGFSHNPAFVSQARAVQPPPLEKYPLDIAAQGQAAINPWVPIGGAIASASLAALIALISEEAEQEQQQ